MKTEEWWNEQSVEVRWAVLVENFAPITELTNMKFGQLPKDVQDMLKSWREDQ